VVEEEEGTMVAMDAVMADAVDAAMAEAVDADEDKSINILDQPIQQIKVCVAASSPMCLDMAKSLQQI
jgi:hypothetical protein